MSLICTQVVSLPPPPHLRPLIQYASKVAPKGQAAALGIRESWRLTHIVGKKKFPITATSTPKSVLEALAATRKEGKPYTLSLSTPAGDGSGMGEKLVSCEAGGADSVDNGGVNSTDETDSLGGEPQESEISGSAKEVGEGNAVEEKQDNPPPDDGVGENGEGVGSKGVRADGAPEEGGGVPPDDAPAERGDGEVTLMYEMYDEKFPIKVTSAPSCK